MSSIFSNGNGGAGGGWRPLQSQDASNDASIDITGMLNTYSAFNIIITNMYPASGSSLLTQFSTDGGSSFLSGATDYEFDNYVSYSYPTGAGQSSSISGSSSMTIAPSITNDSTGKAYSGQIWIYDPGATGHAKCNSIGIWKNTSNYYTHSRMGGVCDANTTAVNAITLYMSSGNITAGHFELWGLPKF